MTPPTSNPSSAMSQELSEEKLTELAQWLEEFANEHQFPTDVNFSTQDAVICDKLMEASECVSALLSLQRKNEELVRCLLLCRQYQV